MGRKALPFVRRLADKMLHQRISTDAVGTCNKSNLGLRKRHFGPVSINQSINQSLYALLSAHFRSSVCRWISLLPMLLPTVGSSPMLSRPPGSSHPGAPVTCFDPVGHPFPLPPLRPSRRSQDPTGPTLAHNELLRIDQFQPFSPRLSSWREPYAPRKWSAKRVVALLPRRGFVALDKAVR